MDELPHMEDLKMYFGGLKAIDGLTLSVYAEEMLGIIGPNGTGKTTPFNAIYGVYKPTGGKVLLRGAEVQGLLAHEVAHKGIARTFQILKPLKDLTILDNVVAATGIHKHTGVRSYFRKSHTPEVVERAESILELVGLEKLRDKKARDVSLGYLRRLEVARVLVIGPLLIMLDKPTAGLPNFTINQITELILQPKEQKETIVLIKHNLPTTMKVCDRVVMLNYNERIAESTPAQVQGGPQVIEAYLGEEDD